MRQSTVAVANATLTMAVAVGTALAIVQRAIPPVVTNVLDQFAPATTQDMWKKYGPPVAAGVVVLALGIFALNRRAR